MEPFFETQLVITKVEGKLYSFQEQAEIVPEPVMAPEGAAEGNRVAVCTVLHDGGRFRMWYIIYPEADHVKLGGVLAHAESDDGYTWRRTAVGLLRPDIPGNNYCDLGLRSPTVFIDPESPPASRYRATGYRRPGEESANPQGTEGCFYTAHSADGLHWDLDSPKARWYSGDVINSIYHPNQRRGICAMKFVRRMNGITRRAIWTADLRDGEWGDPVCALVPDDFDDVAAIARGCNSTDYYGMGMLPARSGTVAFICNFRHKLPLSMSPENYAIFGVSDITLAFQAQPGDRWLHAAGRRSFMSCGSQPWNAGWMQTASCPIEVGDEHWLFFWGSAYDHAWELDADWKARKKWRRIRAESGHPGVVGLAKWPKWRLFGYHADPDGVLELELGEITTPSELLLNYKAAYAGSVRVQLFSREGRGDCGDIPSRSSTADCIPLTGDNTGEVVAWKQGTVIQPAHGKRIVARLTMENSYVYAWDVRPLS